MRKQIKPQKTPIIKVGEENKTPVETKKTQFFPFSISVNILN